MITTINEYKIYEEFNRQLYLKWKRENVTLRGMKDIYADNEGGAMLGEGLYTAALGNKALARQYGTVHFLVYAKPKNPIIFNTLIDFDTWFYNLKYKTLGYKNATEFSENTNIKDEILKLGYDGVLIKGREMVNYKPDDNILYFSNETQLEDYYERIISINEMYNNLSNDLVFSKETLEPIDMNEYEIDSIIDILTDQEEIKKFENANNISSMNMTYTDAKRNDILWITCNLKSRNSSSAYPLSEIGCIQVKVLNKFYGLSKLKQLASQNKIK